MRLSRSDTPRRCPAAAAMLAIAALACVSPQPAAASAAGEGVIAPLPSSDYGVQRACAPATPGRVACQALELVPLGGEARAHARPLGMARATPRGEPSPAQGDYGLTPADLHSAYRLPTTATSTQTIALVDAYNDPAAEEDLAAYDAEFNLPPCTKANGCLTQVNQSGEGEPLPFPKTVAELSSARSGARAAEAEEATEWGIEISLDIETARAICESCHIMLVEATEPYGFDLEAAERSAEALGADEISNSWAGPETGESEASDEASPFDHPGTVITAAAGDSGYLSWGSPDSGSVEYPASSPHVVAVGGTRLELSRSGAWSGESVWNGDGASGGGCSTVFDAPAWQTSLSDWSSVGCADKRAVADVAADADPYTGVAVEDSSSPECEFNYDGRVQHWCTIGGTSLASPLIAAVFALAGGADGVAYPASTLYANASSSPRLLHDITEGSNGKCTKPPNPSTGLSGCTAAQEGASCSSRAICLAGGGYDGASGLGTPDGIAAFETSPASGEGEGSSPGAGEGEQEAEGGSGEVESEDPAGGGDSGDPGAHDEAEGEPPDTTAVEVGPASAPPRPSASTAASAGACQLSALVLAADSSLAARSARAKLADIAFSFEASNAAVVQISLTRRLQRHDRTHWQKLARPLRTSVARGHNTRSLRPGSALLPGVYRLTLKARRGSSLSLQFTVR